jgi:hypothetical protein
VYADDVPKRESEDPGSRLHNSTGFFASCLASAGGRETLAVFYRWQRQFFENGPAAFEPKNVAPEDHLHRTIAALHDKIQRKNEVVAELMEEHTKLKKQFENSDQAWVAQDTRDSIVDFVHRGVIGRRDGRATTLASPSFASCGAGPGQRFRFSDQPVSANLCNLARR